MKTGMIIVAALVCAAGSAQGAIIGTAGNIVQIGAPAAVLPGTLFTPVNAVAFDEKQMITGAGPGDIVMNPWVAMPLSPGPWAGLVNSHFIHVDPGAIGAGVLVNGSVTFDGMIIAVEVTSLANIPPANLDATDFLGAVGTAYPTGLPVRGWNGNGQIQVLGATLRFNQVFVPGGNNIDQFRVITQAPAPGSAALLGLAGLMVCRRRRR